MNNFLKIMQGLFRNQVQENAPPSPLDLNSLMKLIEELEEKQTPEPGRRIHIFEYLDYELSLDIEVTGQYRLAVYSGREKKYSFSIRCNQGNYKILRDGIEQTLEFLENKRRISELPDNPTVKGIFFG